MSKPKKERKKQDTPIEKIEKLNERESLLKKGISKLQRELKEIPIKRKEIENQMAGELMRENNLSIDELHDYVLKIKGEARRHGGADEGAMAENETRGSDLEDNETEGI